MCGFGRRGSDSDNSGCYYSNFYKRYAVPFKRYGVPFIALLRNLLADIKVESFGVIVVAEIFGEAAPAD